MAIAAVANRPFHTKSGFDPQTGVYHSLNHLNHFQSIPNNPDLDAATFAFSRFPPPEQATARVALIDAATGRRITYAHLRRSIASLAGGLYYALGIRKNDVVFILSPNSVTYPTICLAVLSIGAVITTANPLNTASEIAKQLTDSGAKLAISSPEEIHKVLPTGVPTLLTASGGGDENHLSIEELIEKCDPLDIPGPKPNRMDTAAILYSSGTTGASKGVVLTHSNLISVMCLLQWSVDVSTAEDDVFLCFIPMFHVYGLAFFALGLFCSGNTVVVMKNFDLNKMLEAIEKYKVSNIPAVPPVILQLVKHVGSNHDLSSLRRVGSGAAALGKDIAKAFRKKFPWVELRQGYGLTETCGAGTFFVSNEEAKGRPGSIARLAPCFSAKVVDLDTGKALPPYKEGELRLKSPTVMKEYLGQVEATNEAFDSEGWLKTGDLCYFDDEGYVYIVDRLKELIKYNGYQVAPTELEAILTAHPRIVDAAVVPVEDEASGQIPLAYVVTTVDAHLTEDKVIQYVANQVAPYKKIRKVGFIDGIPRNAAGKILRKQLKLQNPHQMTSKL